MSREASKPTKVRFVYWPVERWKWNLSGHLPEERLLLHWACVNEDYE